jgi:rare lipoprotein A (peptidoglycan hydrolase)
VVLPSQLVRFQAGGGTPAAVAPASGEPDAPASATTPSEPPAQAVTQTPTQTQTQTQTPTQTQAQAQTETAPSPRATTTTSDPAPVLAATADSEEGEATWYSAAPPGRCASPALPFGTVLTVTNIETGAQTVCTVDDREQAGYPRVVDLSPSGFEQLDGLGRGVVDVTISW